MKTSKLASTLVATLISLAAMSNAAEAIEPEGLRSDCPLNISRAGGYDLNPFFYMEKKKVAPVGQIVKKDDALFYAQYASADIDATAESNIDNIDKSPLTSNWHWQKGETKKVQYLFSGDKKTSYYLIYSGHAYWVSTLDGNMCGNPISMDRRGDVYRWGLPQVYQTQPLKFTFQEATGAQVKSVSMIVKDINAATADIELNVMAGGRSLKKSIQTVDVMGGSFEFGGLTFELNKTPDGWKLVSVSEPVDISAWLHFKLGMPMPER